MVHGQTREQFWRRNGSGTKERYCYPRFRAWGKRNTLSQIDNDFVTKLIQRIFFIYICRGLHIKQFIERKKLIKKRLQNGYFRFFVS